MKILICGKARRMERSLIKALVTRAMTHLALNDSELSIMLTDDAGIRELNKRYRGKDKFVGWVERSEAHRSLQITAN